MLDLPTCVSEKKKLIIRLEALCHHDFVRFLLTAQVYSRAINQVELEIVNWEYCREALKHADPKPPHNLTRNMMCAGGGLDHDSCSVSLELTRQSLFLCVSIKCGFAFYKSGSSIKKNAGTQC